MTLTEPDLPAEPLEDNVACFISHKCERGDGEHCQWMDSRAGRGLRGALEGASVSALVDPFGVGVEVGAHIETLSFDALLFVASPRSLSSSWCAKELAVARFRRVPCFAVRVDDLPGPLPAGLSERKHPDLRDYLDAELDQVLAHMAAEIFRRARLWRAARCLIAEVSADEQRRAARRIEDADDLTAVTELLPLMDDLYTLRIDPVARASLAGAAGGTLAPSAVPVLRRWRHLETDGAEGHPFPRHVIDQALRALGATETT